MPTMIQEPPQPWLIEIPARIIAKTVRQQWQDYTDDCERQRGLMTASGAAKILDVHRSRVYQLLEMEKLTKFEHFGHVWVSCRELMDRLVAPIDRGGRPALSKAA